MAQHHMKCATRNDMTRQESTRHDVRHDMISSDLISLDMTSHYMTIKILFKILLGYSFRSHVSLYSDFRAETECY